MRVSLSTHLKGAYQPSTYTEPLLSTTHNMETPGLYNIQKKELIFHIGFILVRGFVLVFLDKGYMAKVLL